MNLEKYQTFWDAVCPDMLQKMTGLHQFIVAAAPVAVFIGEPVVETNTDEFRVAIYLSKLNADGTAGDPLLDLWFTLLDGDDAGGDGRLAIGLRVTGADAQAYNGYYPERYTEQAWTDDVDELVSRVDQFNVDDFGVQLLAELKSLIASA
ncbi:TPA: hypothetical protein ACYLN4_007258 [Burkholderia lata]